MPKLRPQAPTPSEPQMERAADPTPSSVERKGEPSPLPARQINDIEYIDREGALSILGIKKESLYTYVSRGLIKTASQPGRKTSLYRKADVEKLRTRAGARAGGPRVAQALRYGDPIVQTWVCDITPAGPRYRGVLATDLVREQRSFEFVAELIWSGMPRTRDQPWPTRQASDRIAETWLTRAGAPEDLSPLQHFSHIAVAMSTLERIDDEILQLDSRAAGIRLLQAYAGVAGCFGPDKQYQRSRSSEFIAERLARGFGVADQTEIIQALNAALVLSADHELSAPTFAARICASTGADLFACVAAALMAQAGPMQVGGATDLESLLEMVASDTSSMPKTGADLPCFDHPLYDRDPRAVALLDITRCLPSPHTSFAPVIAFVDRVHRDSNRYPNLFAALVIFSMAAGLPCGSAALLHTLGRTAGWIAHAAEQRLSGTMLRPRAKYMGNSA